MSIRLSLNHIAYFLAKLSSTRWCLTSSKLYERLYEHELDLGSFALLKDSKLDSGFIKVDFGWITIDQIVNIANANTLSFAGSTEVYRKFPIRIYLVQWRRKMPDRLSCITKPALSQRITLNVCLVTLLCSLGSSTFCNYAISLDTCIYNQWYSA